MEQKIKSYIENDEVLKTNIKSIYAMGSFCKNEKYNDIDLNLFLQKNNYMIIQKIRDMIDYFKEKLNIYLDINVIDDDMLNDGFINSRLFIHRYRHSLLFHELKILNNCIYGQRIMDESYISQEELMIEAVKLILTLRHTINKVYLSEQKPENYNNLLKKNVKYAIEFFLIFVGEKNPYIINLNKIKNKYPFLKKQEFIIDKIYDKHYYIKEEYYELFYNFIVDAGNELKRELLRILKHNISSDVYNIKILKEKYNETK